MPERLLDVGCRAERKLLRDHMGFVPFSARCQSSSSDSVSFLVCGSECGFGFSGATIASRAFAGATGCVTGCVTAMGGGMKFVGSVAFVARGAVVACPAAVGMSTGRVDVARVGIRDAAAAVAGIPGELS